MPGHVSGLDDRAALHRDARSDDALSERRVRHRSAPKGALPANPKCARDLRLTRG